LGNFKGLGKGGGGESQWKRWVPTEGGRIKGKKKGVSVENQGVSGVLQKR